MSADEQIPTAEGRARVRASVVRDAATRHIATERIRLDAAMDGVQVRRRWTETCGGYLQVEGG